MAAAWHAVLGLMKESGDKGTAAACRELICELFSTYRGLFNFL